MMNRAWGILVVLVLALAPCARAEDKEVTVAWSVWTGWMPFRVMDQKGFLAKRCQELGVKVKLVEFKGYLESVQAFSAGKVDACAMTSMESLQPAAAGIDWKKQLEQVAKVRDVQLVLSHDVAGLAGWNPEADAITAVDVPGLEEPLEVVDVVRGRDLAVTILAPVRGEQPQRSPTPAES